jgi:hypothetical protein
MGIDVTRLRHNGGQQNFVSVNGTMKMVAYDVEGSLLVRHVESLFVHHGNTEWHGVDMTVEILAYCVVAIYFAQLYRDSTRALPRLYSTQVGAKRTLFPPSLFVTGRTSLGMMVYSLAAT